MTVLRNNIIYLQENQIKKTLRKRDKKYFSKSMIIYDNGGNLLAKYEAACIKYHYNIKVLNLIDITKSHMYNPLASCDTENDVMVFVNEFLQFLQSDSIENKLLLETIALGLFRCLSKSNRTIERIMKALPAFGTSKKHAEGMPALNWIILNGTQSLYNAFVASPNKSDLYQRATASVTTDLLNLTSDNQIDFCEYKTVYFVLYEDNNPNNWLLKVFTQQAINKLKTRRTDVYVYAPDEIKKLYQRAMHPRSNTVDSIDMPQLVDIQENQTANPLNNLNPDGKTENQIQSNIKYTPQNIEDIFAQHIIGQDEAKMAMAVAIFTHFLRVDDPNSDIQKTNILLCGPTGCGKTEFARTIAEELKLPFVIFDATTITETGYRGIDAHDILKELYFAANKNIKKAQQGIVYIDEIDKLAVHGANAYRDSHLAGTQQCFLRLIEDGIVQVPLNKEEAIAFDTTNVLFIFGGAFPQLTSSMDKQKSISIGFQQTQTKITEKTVIEPETLVKYGMEREFIGRIPVILQLNALTENDIFRIIKEPKHCIVNQYTNLFRHMNVDISFTDELIKLIAKDAVKSGFGARSIKAIFEKMMRGVIYTIGSSIPTEKQKLVIDVDTYITGVIPDLQIIYEDPSLVKKEQEFGDYFDDEAQE